MPFFGILYLKKAPVYAHKIVLLTGVFAPGSVALIRAHPGENRTHLAHRGDPGRLEGKLVTGVYIEGPVIPLELPTAGHGYPIPLHLLRVQNGGHPGWLCIEMKIPIAA